MNSYYDIAQVCLNGHTITEMAGDHPEYKRDRCEDCGERTICECQKCNEPIQGYYHSGVIGIFEYTPPRFCQKCGEPFPWIATKLETAKEIVDMMDSLNQQEKEDLKSSIIELVKETAKVSIAKVKLKRYLKKVDSDISDGLNEVLVDVLSEELGKSIK